MIRILYEAYMLFKANTVIALYEKGQFDRHIYNYWKTLKGYVKWTNVSILCNKIVSLYRFFVILAWLGIFAGSLQVKA